MNLIQVPILSTSHSHLKRHVKENQMQCRSFLSDGGGGNQKYIIFSHSVYFSFSFFFPVFTFFITFSFNFITSKGRGGGDSPPLPLNVSFGSANVLLYLFFSSSLSFLVNNLLVVCGIMETLTLFEYEKYK